MTAIDQHGLFTGEPVLTATNRSVLGSFGRNICRAAWFSRRVLLPVILLLLWEAGVRVGAIDRNLFPAPTQIFTALVDLAELGRLFPDILASVSRICVGFTLASIAGIAIGVLLGRFHRAAEFILPVIELIRPISVIAWIPIAILWFGLGDRSAWFLIFLGSFFPIFTNTYFGVRSVQPIHIQVAQCLGAGRWLFLREVLLPSALPYILSGMRIGLGTGWTCVIAAELITASSGLGYMIQVARAMIETEKVLGGMVIIGAIGFAMNYLMGAIERRLTLWRPNQL